MLKVWSLVGLTVSVLSVGALRGMSASGTSPSVSTALQAPVSSGPRAASLQASERPSRAPRGRAGQPLLPRQTLPGSLAPQGAPGQPEHHLARSTLDPIPVGSDFGLIPTPSVRACTT
ncbi:MAG: hypothetical protein R3E96_16165 [Planctomycetota bacterium]